MEGRNVYYIEGNIAHKENGLAVIDTGGVGCLQYVSEHAFAAGQVLARAYILMYIYARTFWTYTAF